MIQQKQQGSFTPIHLSGLASNFTFTKEIELLRMTVCKNWDRGFIYILDSNEVCCFGQRGLKTTKTMLNAQSSETMNAVHYVLYFHYHQLEGSVRQKLEIWSCSNLVTLTLSAVLRQGGFSLTQKLMSRADEYPTQPLPIYIHYLKLDHTKQGKTLQ